MQALEERITSEPRAVAGALSQPGPHSGDRPVLQRSALPPALGARRTLSPTRPITCPWRAGYLASHPLVDTTIGPRCVLAEFTTAGPRLSFRVRALTGVGGEAPSGLALCLPLRHPSCLRRPLRVPTGPPPAAARLPARRRCCARTPPTSRRWCSRRCCGRRSASSGGCSGARGWRRPSRGAGSRGSCRAPARTLPLARCPLSRCLTFAPPPRRRPPAPTYCWQGGGRLPGHRGGLPRGAARPPAPARLGALALALAWRRTGAKRKPGGCPALPEKRSEESARDRRASPVTRNALPPP